MRHRRITLPFSAATGGVLAAAFLPMAVASADIYDFVPDPTTFEPQDANGYPPVYDLVMGQEDWSAFDATSGKLVAADQMLGNDTETTFGSFTNNDFVVLKDLGTTYFAPVGTQIDLADYGGGFGNEWIDIPAGGTAAGVSDLFITPFGDFPILGAFF